MQTVLNKVFVFRSGGGDRHFRGKTSRQERLFDWPRMLRGTKPSPVRLCVQAERCVSPLFLAFIVDESVTPSVHVDLVGGFDVLQSHMTVDQSRRVDSAIKVRHSWKRPRLYRVRTM